MKTMFDMFQSENFDRLDHKNVLKELARKFPAYVWEVFRDMDPALREVCPAEFVVIRDHLTNNQLVSAIKAIRTYFSCGLMEAKLTVDILRDPLSDPLVDRSVEVRRAVNHQVKVLKESSVFQNWVPPRKLEPSFGY
jgi:hypothetical protein